MNTSETSQVPPHVDAMDDILPGIEQYARPQQPAPTATMLASPEPASPQSFATSTNINEHQSADTPATQYSKSASPHPSITSSNTHEEPSLGSITLHCPEVPDAQILHSALPQAESLTSAQISNATTEGSNAKSEVMTHELGTSVFTQIKPVKIEKAISPRNELFVAHDDTDASPPATTLKRPNVEADEKKPVRASARRKKARGNPDMVPPYDDADEKKDSQFAVDQPCFAEVEQLVSTIGEMILNELEALAREGYQEDEIDRRKKKLLKAMSPARRGVSSWFTGIVGDTGCGKSSLINSLLNEQNATAEGDSGNVGTFVVNEFAMEENLSSTAQFRSIVWYYNPREIGRLVKDHFAAVYTWENMNQRDKADLDVDEDEKYKNDCKMGAEFFETLLCGADSTLRLASLDAVKIYIKSASSATDETKIGALRIAIQAYLTSLNRVDGATTLYASDKAEIIALTSKYAGRKHGDTQPSPWPLVKNITAYRPDPRILSGGLVLADLPGLSDTNSGRANAAKQYSTKCRTTIIAHDILRILTHPNVAKVIQNNWRAGRIGNVIIVATKTDILKHGESRATNQVDQKMFETLTDELKELKEEAADLKEAADEVLEDNEDVENYKLIKRDADAKARAAIEAEQSLREFNITLRNNNVTSQMQKLVQTLTGSTTATNVPIFCVSNAQYQKHRSGYERNKLPDLTVSGTQIPALREHLYRAPAAKKLSNFLKVCKVYLPTALTGFELHCSKSRLEIKDEVLPVVERPYVQFKAAKNKTKNNLQKHFQDRIHEVLATKENDWKALIKTHVACWGKQHWCRFLKFCKLDGVWQAKKGDELIETDWNQSIADVLADGLTAGFDAIRKDFTSVRDVFEDTLKQSFADVRVEFEDSAELGGMDLRAFYTSLDQRSDAITDYVRELFVNLEERMNDIRHRTLIPDNDESYIRSLMRDIYKSCIEVNGTGSHKKRVETLKQALTGQFNIFRQTLLKAVAAFDSIAQTWAEDADALLADEFRGVFDDFDNLFTNDPKVDPEEETKKAFRKRLLVKVREAQFKLGTELKPKVAECEKYD